MSPVPNSLRRVLLYSHDTYGLGHLRRNLAIARRLLEQRPGLRVLLMTGSSVAERFPLPRGLMVLRLPPVVKVGAGEYRPRDERWDFDLARRARTAIMSDAARRFRPDVFLVDHAPQGMKGELLQVFATIRSTLPATRIVLGLRDVLDDPETVRKNWSEQGVYETLETAFDRVLVYGSQDVFDVVGAYGIPPAVAAKLEYCGYVCRPPVPEPSAHQRGAPFVLGTAGGGGDGAEVLTSTLVASAALGVPSLVVTGPLMGAEERLQLARRTGTGSGAEVVEFVPDLAASARQAIAVVTMGGYNTLCEMVSTGVPTVVVPRVHPRREQAIRAELFSRVGAVSAVMPGPGLGDRLQEALEKALSSGPRRGPVAIDLGGLDRVDAALENEAEKTSEDREAA
jgi:predicted glycosyltransferase